MIVHDLSESAVRNMVCHDLAHATEPPPSPIGEFDFNGCVCGVACFEGQPPWELHTTGDEMLHVLAGESELVVREAGGPVRRQLRAGDLAIVPKGCWHRNFAPGGVTMLFVTPAIGGRHTWDDPDDAVLTS